MLQLRRTESRRRTEVRDHSRVARRRRRTRFRVLTVLLVVLLVGGLVPADFLLHHDRVHAGVHVGGAHLGGQARDEVMATLDGVAARVGARRLQFTWEDRRFTASLDELGWRPELGETAAAALAVGRSGSLSSDIRTRARAWVSRHPVEWRGSWDLQALIQVLERWERVAGAAPKEGRAWVQGTRVRSRDPEPGRAIDVSRIAALASAAVATAPERPLPLPTEPVPARTAGEDVGAAVAEIRRLLDGPVTVRIGSLRLDVSPRDLGALVTTSVVDEGSEASLAVELSEDGVRSLLAPHREEVERAPQPARFVTSGPRVRIEPSAPGREIDPRVAAEALLRIARSPDRRGRIPLARVEPSFTTEQARALGIVRQVSNFTTFHPAGEPRVINIHRAAEILDGAIVKPGEAFSLNQHLGQRTAERGFVSAPVIYEGRFTQDIGGGVSQLATTLFNAAFFGGYPFHEYQAHSYYISRYPQGREATVSWPKPDLVFENDTKAAVLIKTEYTGDSITVRIFGTRGRRRVTATDPVVIDRQSSGYWVAVDRIVEEGGEVVRRETFRTFYRHGTH